MDVAQFCVAVGLVNEAKLGTWFISERLRDGGYLFLAGKLLAPPSARYMYTFFCIFLWRVFCDLLGFRAYGREEIFDIS
jgi:hypothetical protein